MSAARTLLFSTPFVLVLACGDVTGEAGDDLGLAAARAKSSAVCQTHPNASFAQTRLMLTENAEGSFDLDYAYWLQIGGSWSWDDPERPEEPGSLQKWNLARGLTCWAGAAAVSHYRPVRRVRQPDASTVVLPLVYCEGAGGRAQLSLQRETHPSTGGAGPITFAEDVALYDAPDLASILPEPRLTILDTLYQAYSERITGASGDTTFHTCAWAGALRP
jgi:hypothetical protein